MKISIITVCRNAQDCIEETIRSVLLQTYKNIEYIVIDGKSTDNTLQIIEKYKDKIDYLLSEEDNGVYDAMNKAINVATGDVLFFLNAGDTFLHENIVDVVMSRYFKEDTKVLYGDILAVDKIRGRSAISKYGQVNKMFFMGESICHQCIFFRSKMFDKYGLFNTDYKLMADNDWLLRVFVKDKTALKYKNLVICIYPLGGLSWTPNIRNKEWETLINSYFSPLQKIVYKYLLRKLKKDSFLRSFLVKLLD